MAVTIIILIITCIVYTYSLLHGFKGISILAKAASICSLVSLLLYCCLAERQDILSKPGFPHLDGWHRTFLNWLPIQIRNELLPFPRTGPYSIGLLDGLVRSGSVFLLEVFPGGGQFARRFLVDIYLEWVPPLLVLLFWEIILWDFRCPEKPILSLFMKSQEICMM